MVTIVMVAVGRRVELGKSVVEIHALLYLFI